MSNLQQACDRPCRIEPKRGKSFGSGGKASILSRARRFAATFSVLGAVAHLAAATSADAAIDLVYDDSGSMRGFVNSNQRPIAGAASFRQLIETLQTSLPSIGDVRVCSFTCRGFVPLSEGGRFQPFSAASYGGTVTRIDSALRRISPTRLTVIVTDMFQSEADAAQLVDAIRPTLSDPRKAIGLVATRTMFQGYIDGRDIGSQFGSFFYNGSLPLYFLFVGNVCEVRDALDNYAATAEGSVAAPRDGRAITLISAGACPREERSAALRILDTNYVHAAPRMTRDSPGDPPIVGKYRLYGRPPSAAGQLLISLPIAPYKVAANSTAVKVGCVQRLEGEHYVTESSEIFGNTYPRQAIVPGQGQVGVTISISPDRLSPNVVYRVILSDGEATERRPLTSTWASLDLGGRDLQQLRLVPTLDELQTGFASRNRTPNLGTILARSWQIALAARARLTPCTGKVGLYLKKMR